VPPPPVPGVTPAPTPQDPAPFWPSTKGQTSVVTEWYSDIPWHQKLGTQAGNEIDEALVLPYEALGATETNYCSSKGLSPEDCMIETGISNILGIYRIDTPYDPKYPNINAKGKCQSNLQPPQKCTEVKLALSMFWTRSTGSAITLQPRPFGAHNPELPYPPPGNAAYYGGYAITDGTSYAPQLPWFMSHYCDAGFIAIPNTAPPRLSRRPGSCLLRRLPFHV
jgi:hypothetical protein